jgi:hypothetical protein
MKNIILKTLTLAMVTFAACAKQKDCEAGFVGTFQYLENALYIKPNDQFPKKKVIAILYDTDSREYYITGWIPNTYKSGKLIKVRAQVKDIHENDIKLLHNAPQVYKLVCIEKED